MKSALMIVSVLFLLQGCGAPAPQAPVADETETAPELATLPPEQENVEADEPTVAEHAAPRTAAPPETAELPKEQPAAAGALPKLYDFWATWCPPCRQQKPIIEELKKEYAGVVDVIAIDVDQDGELAKRYEVKVIPTLVMLDAAGNEVERFTGLTQKDKLVERFRAHGFIQ